MQNLKNLILSAGVLSTLGCATSFKGKMIESTLIGAGLGAVIGQSRPDYPNQNAVLYGSLGAVAGALYATYKHDPYKENENLKLANEKLKAQLDQISQPKVAFETPATFNSKIPEKYRKLVNPGEWKVFEIDQWIEDGENRLIHQDKIMELIPPSLKTFSQGGN